MQAASGFLFTRFEYHFIIRSSSYEIMARNIMCGNSSFTFLHTHYTMVYTATQVQALHTIYHMDFCSPLIDKITHPKRYVRCKHTA